MQYSFVNYNFVFIYIWDDVIQGVLKLLYSGGPPA
jgi:hypothetical protein